MIKVERATVTDTKTVFKEYFITVFHKDDAHKHEKISREELSAEVLKILESLVKESDPSLVGFYVGVGKEKET